MNNYCAQNTTSKQNWVHIKQNLNLLKNNFNYLSYRKKKVDKLFYSIKLSHTIKVSILSLYVDFNILFVQFIIKVI